MDSINDEVIRKTKELLLELCKQGKEQLEKFKKEHPKKTISEDIRDDGKMICVDGILLPKNVATAKTLIDSDNFFQMINNGYWSLFEEVVKSIENPIVLFSMRSLMEIAFSQIVYFVGQSPGAKKEIASQYWLIIEAMTKETIDPSIDVYDDLIKFLSEDKNKERFLEIKSEGFKLREVSREMHRLFPSIRDERLFELIKPHWKSLVGEDLSQETFENTFLWMCQYVHGNIIITNEMLKDVETKDHLPRSAFFLGIISLTLLSFLGDEVPNMDVENEELKERLKDHFKDMNQYLKKIHQQGS
jgi:hypothetical protein